MSESENKVDRPCLDCREGPLTAQAAAALDYRERGWRVGVHGRRVRLLAGQPCDDALRTMGWLSGELRVEHVKAAEPLDLPPSGGRAPARWITGPDHPVPRAVRVTAVLVGIVIRGTR